MSTVGYGDIYPLTTGAKIYGAAFIIIGVSLLARVVGTFLDRMEVRRTRERQTRMLNQSLVNPAQLAEFDEDGSGIQRFFCLLVFLFFYFILCFVCLYGIV